jgi:hypothetical protein
MFFSIIREICANLWKEKAVLVVQEQYSWEFSFGFGKKHVTLQC